MWFSLKKSLADQGVFQSFTDNHSHILPGVDDGVKTLDDALTILSAYEKFGMTEVWLTPHIQEFIPNTTQQLQDRYTELQAAYTGGLTLHLAAEYMLDNIFFERLETKDLLLHSLPGQEPRLLIETSYYNPPIRFWETIQDILSTGIRPILAHPERYLYMEKDDYSRLRNMGVLLQMNIPSVLGVYGNEPCKRAKRLLKDGFYSMYGTDVHSPRFIDMFQKEKTSKLVLNF